MTSKMEISQYIQQIYIDQLLLLEEKYDENTNSMDYALKQLDKNTISKIFIYTDVKKFNKSVTIIQDLKKDKNMIKKILKELKKNIWYWRNL